MDRALSLHWNTAGCVAERGKWFSRLGGSRRRNLALGEEVRERRVGKQRQKDAA